MKIIILPNKITLQQAQDLRSQAEKGSDPDLYRAAAEAFKILGMKESAQAMERRADHYKA